MGEAPTQSAHGCSFGEILLTRRPRPVLWVGIAFIIFVFSFGGVFLGFMNFLHPPIGFQPNLHASVLAIELGLVGMPASCWLALRLLGTRVDFHERGVVHRRWGRAVSACDYEDVVELSLAIVRQYASGVYAGSLFHVTIGFLGPARPGVISISGKHAERSVGLGFTLLYQRFEGEDDIEAVCRLIARAMVAKRLREGTDGRLRWGDSLELTPRGVEPLDGPLAGVIVPYDLLDVRDAGGGEIGVLKVGDDEPFARMRRTQPNFLVGIEYINAIRGMSVTAERPVRPVVAA